MFETCSDLSKIGLTNFVNIKKMAQKMAKRPNHFISGKQFQKR